MNAKQMADYFCERHFDEKWIRTFRELTDEERLLVLERLGAPCSKTGSLDCSEACCNWYASAAADE